MDYPTPADLHALFYGFGALTFVFGLALGFLAGHVLWPPDPGDR
jgi:hypothetical protein